MTIEFDKNGFAITAGVVIVYNVIPNTYEYIGLSTEFLNPGQGLPAHSYIDEPLKAKKGFAICRTQDNKAWEYIADHRGETRYSTTSKQAVIINELGGYPVNTTDSAPGQFDIWKDNIWVVDEAAKLVATKKIVTLRKAELKNIADGNISWRNDAVTGGYADEQEKIDLLAWQKYRVLLMRVDTSQLSDIEWPISPV
ncbi:TPA: tail fiber assembly protein [Yersinia enterocolitica]